MPETAYKIYSKTALSKEVPKELKHTGVQSQWQILLVTHWTFFLSDQQPHVGIMSPRTVVGKKTKSLVNQLQFNYFPLCELTLANVLPSQSMIQN